MPAYLSTRCQERLPGLAVGWCRWPHSLSAGQVPAICGGLWGLPAAALRTWNPGQAGPPRVGLGWGRCRRSDFGSWGARHAEDTAGCAGVRSAGGRRSSREWDPEVVRRARPGCRAAAVHCHCQAPGPRVGDPLPEGFSPLAVLKVRLQLKGDLLNLPWRLHPAVGGLPASEPPHTSLDSDVGWLSALFLDKWRLSNSCACLQSVVKTLLEGSPRVCREGGADRLHTSVGDTRSAPLPQLDPLLRSRGSPGRGRVQVRAGSHFPT